MHLFSIGKIPKKGSKIPLIDNQFNLRTKLSSFFYNRELKFPFAFYSYIICIN